jgi:hypothetical protein
VESFAFAVDTMLGRLARWLRILGYDAAYGSHLHGATLARVARREQRVILTRDRQLLRDRNLPAHVFIEHDDFRAQLRQVAARLGLRGQAAFSRCIACNRPVESVSPATVRDRVPAYVAETQAEFWECGGCGRVYWPATHRTHIVAELRAMGLVEGAA